MRVKPKKFTITHEALQLCKHRHHDGKNSHAVDLVFHLPDCRDTLHNDEEQHEVRNKNCQPRGRLPRGERQLIPGISSHRGSHVVTGR